MQSSTITKITTGTLAALLAGSIGFGIHQSNQADAAQRAATSWQQESAAWQATATTTQAANQKLVRRYNRLAVQAREAAQAGNASLASAQNATATITQNAAPAAPAVQAAPAQAPTSQAS